MLKPVGPIQSSSLPTHDLYFISELFCKGFNKEFESQTPTIFNKFLSSSHPNKFNPPTEWERKVTQAYQTRIWAWPKWQ